MNCSQARELLSIYRELKNRQVDTTALDVHLAECAACRRLQEQYRFIGEGIRSLPPVEPASEAYSKLMQALSAEHARYLQHSAASSAEYIPTPDFLKPYLKEQVQKEPITDALTAFSSAETGPLPIVQIPRKRRPSPHMSHLTVLGLAAAFLMVIMMGGLTSLLLLAKNSQSLTISGGQSQVNISRPSEVASATYTTTSSYQHVVSAVANRDAIYYTAHDGSSANWMLERLDDQTRVSTPLLATPSTSPLIVLGSSNDWLLWLQFDLPKTVVIKKSAHHETSEIVRTWTLYALPQNIHQDIYTPGAVMPVAVQQGTFDQNTVPAWIHTPIQGVWFTQHTLLVAWVDAKGHSYLNEDQIGQVGDKVTTTTLATAPNDHIFTSPTANSDGTGIYWGEEWYTNDNVLHGNIWTQQTIQAEPQSGRWVPHTVMTKYLFRSDGTSFRPQVVNNTLFLLSTATPNATNATNQPQQTATASVTATAQATASPTAGSAAPDTTMPGITPRFDPSSSLLQPDAAVQGTLLAFPVNDDTQIQLPLNTDGPISALQGGERFLLWQGSDNSFNMYDVVAKTPIPLNSTMSAKNISFLAVNGDSAVWLVNTNTSGNTPTPQANATPSPVIFSTFNWPARIAVAR